MPVERVSHQFVEFIPEELDEATLYISIPYATVVHLCLCGCREKVITPLTPTDWRLIFDGETVSLHPSVGNWSFDCQSHYVIKRSRVIWAGRWSRAEIQAARLRDRYAKDRYYGEHRDDERPGQMEGPPGSRPGLVQRLISRLRR
jgi:hypothetical protein